MKSGIKRYCWENLQLLQAQPEPSRQAPRPQGAKDPTIFQTLSPQN